MPNPTLSKTEKEKLINDWINYCNLAVNRIFNWRSDLISWKKIELDIPDEVFMAALDDLAKDGLLYWVDGCPHGIVQLREAVTGQEV